jgi:hypothetical protein
LTPFAGVTLNTLKMLNEALPLALDAMTRESEGLHSPVAPVDLSQAIIGPGMAIFSRYDADTQFCLHWFNQYGWESGIESAAAKEPGMKQKEIFS